MSLIYTIGQSNLSTQSFVINLKRNSINAVCDVRSYPYSKTFPAFNRTNLQYTLLNYGILYIYFGDKLGGKEFFNNSKLLDESIIELCDIPIFDNGLAIMCSEANPYKCHREFIISEKLRKLGHNIFHIDSNGNEYKERK